MLGLLDRRLYLFAPIALLLAALPAHAAIVTYTNLTSWLAASSVVSTIDFEGLAPANGSTSYNTSAGVTLPATTGVQFIGKQSATPTYVLSVVDGTPSYYNFNSGASLKGPSYDVPPGFVPYVKVILPSNVSAFGVDLMTLNPNALTYQITLPGAITFTANTANLPARTFWGITSDTPIAYADFTVLGTTNGAGTFGLMDNFRYGTAVAAPAETPEASTMLFIGTGLIGIRLLRKLRPRQQGAAAQPS